MTPNNINNQQPNIHQNGQSVAAKERMRAYGAEQVNDHMESGRGRIKNNREVKKEKKFHIVQESKKSYRILKSDLDNIKKNRYANSRQKKGPGAVFGAIMRFIGRCFYIFFRTIWRFFVYLAVMVLGICVIGIGAVGYLYASTVGDLPQLQDFTQTSLPQDSTIYDIDNEIIGVISSVRRIPVGVNQVAQSAKDALVSIEDERFFTHDGVDFYGIARSIKENFDSWRNGGSLTKQGASTITQQYVRNAYESVGTEQTIARKLTEIALAVELEATMSKDDILNSYMNTVFYGNGCYGIEAASQFYFGHSAADLDYYESALLAAIVNAPSIYDLTTEEGRAETADRANLVLDKMYSLGKLGDMTQDGLHDLKKTDVNMKVNITEVERQINEPFYYDYVMSELLEDYTEDEIKSGGWQIYTTLSIEDGRAAAEVVRGINEYYDNGITAAIADVDVETGSVRAFCGGVDYEISEYNIATSSQLQTGSSLKPIVYSALMEYDGYYITDQFDATPVNVAGEGETPHIITPYVSGATATINQGIIASDNAMAIHAGNTLGMDKVSDMCYAVGMETQIDDNVIAVIGGTTTGFTPLEMATAYATVANKGMKRDLWCIRSINDNYGNLIYEHEYEEDYAMSTEVANQITRAMENAVHEASWYDIPFAKEGGWHIAAKTGTTDDDMDLWCVGFDSVRSVAVWVGGRDQKMTVPGSGSSKTCRTFSDYMYKVAQGDPKVEFEQPQYKTVIPTLDKDQTLDDYMIDAEGKRFDVEVAYVDPSEFDEKDNIKSGDIIGVKNEGTLADRGSTIQILVARDKVVVPDFTKMSPNQVYQYSDGLKINYDVSFVTSGSSSPSIVEQSIPAGEIADVGSMITLKVNIMMKNNESSITQMPLKGSDDVMSVLEQERDLLAEKNKRMEQELNYYLENEDTSAKTSVVPDVSGLTPLEARQVLESLGFGVVYQGSASITIVETSPEIGSKVIPGSTIELLTETNTNKNTNSSNTSNRNINSNRNTNSNSNTSNDNSNSNRNSNSNEG